MSLKGKVAIVTGGNSGIGRAISLALSRAGAEIAIDYVANPEATEALEREIASLGDQSIGVDADVGQVGDLQRTRGCSRFEIRPHRYHGQQRWRRDPDVDLGYDRG